MEVNPRPINHRRLAIRGSRLTSRDRHATEQCPFTQASCHGPGVKRGWRVRGWSANIFKQAHSLLAV